MKVYHSRFDPVMDNFRGLYETLGYIVVRGDPEEHFLDYGFCKQNSKILYSCQKKGPLVLLVVQFSKHINCNMNLAFHRLHTQISIISYLLRPIEAKK